MNIDIILKDALIEGKRTIEQAKGMNFGDTSVVYGKTGDIPGEYFVNLEVDTNGNGYINQPVIKSCTKEIAEMVTMYLHEQLKLSYYKE